MMLVSLLGFLAVLQFPLKGKDTIEAVTGKGIMHYLLISSVSGGRTKAENPYNYDMLYLCYWPKGISFF